MKLGEILKENADEFDEDLAAHNLDMMCHNIYRKITKLKPASKKMEIVVQKGRSWHIEEHDVTIENVIFVDDYHTAPYHNSRNKSKQFLGSKNNSLGLNHPGATHRKFGMVFEMSDGNELDLGGTVDKSRTAPNDFEAALFTGGIHYGAVKISPTDNKTPTGRKGEIELKKGDFAKINKALVKSNWDDLSAVALDTYAKLCKQRVEKLENH